MLKKSGSELEPRLSWLKPLSINFKLIINKLISKMVMLKIFQAEFTSENFIASECDILMETFSFSNRIAKYSSANL